MADIYEVQTALTNLAQTAIYPNGITSPSIVNADVRIYPGNPIPSTLDADLTLKKSHISIFPSNISRVTTRFHADWDTINQNTATLSLIVNNEMTTVTVSGTITLYQACMLIVNGKAYSYAVQATDTLNSIASNLAALIPNASANGNVITILYCYNLVSRVIVTGSAGRELAREKRLIVVSVWAPTPLFRSQLASAIQILFASTYRVGLQDGYYGQLSYEGSNEIDILEKVKCYKRDIHFNFEYPITQTSTDYTIGDNNISVTSYNDGNPYIPFPL